MLLHLSEENTVAEGGGREGGEGERGREREGE